MWAIHSDMLPDINIKDYGYPLTENRIAKYPLPERDSSKLLLYKNGEISTHVFRELPGLLPGSGLMIFNDTKVVPARLHFEKGEAGAKIEIFCLEPSEPPEYDRAFATVGHSEWKCVIGNSKRWKQGSVSLCNPDSAPEVAAMDLRATLIEKDGRTGTVRFDWEGGLPFSKVLETAGTIPIPPYLNRESEAIDIERYQTTYAHWRGSVAAPTAGLHFTTQLLEKLEEKGVKIGYVTLHVGLGTFRPVKEEDITQHIMHSEHYVLPPETADLINQTKANGGRVISVGTTSCRTLEAVATLRGKIEAAEGDTDIFIYPGYEFKCIDGLITNFHLPESTLIMLVSAFCGYENTMNFYKVAVEEKYRFFSFGDACFIV